LSCFGERAQRLDLGLGAQRLDLDRAPRLDDALIGTGLGQADVRRHLVVGGVDRGQRRSRPRTAARSR
jgi:hypothetical protein